MFNPFQLQLKVLSLSLNMTMTLPLRSLTWNDPALTRGYRGFMLSERRHLLTPPVGRSYSHQGMIRVTDFCCDVTPDLEIVKGQHQQLFF